ncbi:MAG: crosslink repair DNA glycosylase YcaQ family protein [Acidimicrobiia bacterium]
MLDRFSPAVAAWFTANFPEPTAPQREGWPAIANGDHTLICSPTGSGKTLSAFLWGIDRLVTTPRPEAKTHRTRLLYVSPLRALAFDVEKNLRSPLIGIRLAAERLGVEFHEPVVAMRTGDTSARDRARLIRNPADLLITTPESLYLMLTSTARDTLRGVEAIIIDEIHALAPTKRGAHLALSLERLDLLCDTPPQRIGLSATQRPLEEVARFLGGFTDAGRPRPVTIVDAGVRKPLELTVVVPVEDMGEMGKVTDEIRSGPASAGPAKRSIWPAIHPRIVELIAQHRTTIVFTNARRLAERLAARLNEEAELQGLVQPDANGFVPELVKAHHGSLAREQRVIVEDQLKRGELRAIVATSSLELGIDMGAVDLVIQVESPGAVSRGMQRVGRAGHSVGEPSRGTIFPKHRGDLVETAVVVEQMLAGNIESTRYLRNPLDVLAQQIVAQVAGGDMDEPALKAMVRRCANFNELTDDVWVSVLDLLAGRYPSEEFAELRPRIVWDRSGGVIRARDGSRRLAVTSGGTIPDRGLFGVFLPDGTRVGELDEEMVYESRAGETFLLGASTWRIEDITVERVIVTPAPGQPGKMPFWHGDRPGRPLELGQALGAFVRKVRDQPEADAIAGLQEHNGLDEWAAQNLVQYLREQSEHCGAVPDDRTVVIERFRDEIGDWRVCILTPFGTPVHAPWAMAIQSRLGDRLGMPVETMWSDDGIVLRLPDAADHLDLDDIIIDPDEIEELVVSALPSTALFSARFRECAARALLLPRRRPDRRTPLWQQRQRAADLLTVAAKYPQFPILLEASRECLQDVFDVPSLRTVLGGLRSRAIRVVQVDTASASPFSQSLLFNWIANYMYEGDAPLAERRAAALSLDRDLLRELLGSEELRELIDPDVLADLELDLQYLTDGRAARDIDEAHDLLRLLGPLTIDELALRCTPELAGRVSSVIDALVSERRAFTAAIGNGTPGNGTIGAGGSMQVGSEGFICAAEDAARLRDGLGVPLPLGLPRAFTEAVPRPLEELVARYARTHGPFHANEVANRLGSTAERIEGALHALEADGRVVRGEFRPGGSHREWCDNDVLRMLRRRSLAALRREVEPVEPETLARFLPAWQGIGPDGSRGVRRGVDALVEALGVLQGASLMASGLDANILPARVADYRASDLDALCTSGDVVWIGAGGHGAADGRIRLYFRDQVAVLAKAPDPEQRPTGQVHDAIMEMLATRGSAFWSGLVAAAPGASEAEVLSALWDLVWSGWITNDSLAAVRSFLRSKPTKSSSTRPKARPRPGRLNRVGPPAGAGRWSLTAELLSPAPTPTAQRHALALQLLDRHGVLSREAVLAEGIEGGFTAVYGVLKALEERGQVRRGYFVAGLGAAQFALPGAVDRLRSLRGVDDARPRADEVRDDEPLMVLSAVDPAQPYGAALAWPPNDARPSRAPHADVVLAAGRPLVWIDRSSRHLVTFPGAFEDARWATRLAASVKDGRWPSLEVRKIDGALASEHDAAALLRGAGFVDGYRGLVIRH